MALSTQLEFLPPGIVVEDSFLPPTVFRKAFEKLKPHCSALQQAGGKREKVFHIDLPAAKHAIRSFIARVPATKNRSALQKGRDNGQVVTRLHWGNQANHVDGYCSTASKTESEKGTGKKYSSVVSLVYLSGSGTLVFKELEGSRREYRVNVCSNRAVRFDNTKFSHRVETQTDQTPRVILGPYTMDCAGDLKESMNVDFDITCGCIFYPVAYPASLVCLLISCAFFTAAMVHYFSASAKASVQGYAAAVNISNAANGTSGEMSATTATSLPIGVLVALFLTSGICLTCGVVCGSVPSKNTRYDESGLGVWCKETLTIGAWCPKNRARKIRDSDIKLYDPTLRKRLTKHECEALVTALDDGDTDALAAVIRGRKIEKFHQPYFKDHGPIASLGRWVWGWGRGRWKARDARRNRDIANRRTASQWGWRAGDRASSDRVSSDTWDGGNSGKHWCTLEQMAQSKGDVAVKALDDVYSRTPQVTTACQRMWLRVVLAASEQMADHVAHGNAAAGAGDAAVSIIRFFAKFAGLKRFIGTKMTLFIGSDRLYFGEHSCTLHITELTEDPVDSPRVMSTSFWGKTSRVHPV